MRRTGRSDRELPGRQQLGETVGRRQPRLAGHEGRLHALQEGSGEVVWLACGEHWALLNREHSEGYDKITVGMSVNNPHLSEILDFGAKK